MKKVLSVLVVLCLLFTLAACVAEVPDSAPGGSGSSGGSQTDQGSGSGDSNSGGSNSGNGNSGTNGTGNGGSDANGGDNTFPGKIAIVTNTVDQNEEEYRSAQALQLKYGTDKVIHRTWPVRFSEEGEMMISILQEIANDPEVFALVINQAVINTNAAVDKFREMRGDDVFIVYCLPAENPDDVAARADLVLEINHPLVGESFVKQAKALGAETIAHYTFPRHMSVPLLARRRDVMKAASEREGINFVELVAPDPMADGGQPATQMHITQDLPRQVEMLGVNTAFFGTNCGMQIPLINQVIATGAIYPMPCDPSPYHGFPTALGISARIPTGEFDPNSGAEIMRFRNLTEVITATRAAINAQGAAGRLSTWQVPISMMFTTIGAGYAIEWIHGRVPQEVGVIDAAALDKLAQEYIIAGDGEADGFDLTTYDIDGTKYSHFFLGLVDFLTY